MPNLRHSQWRRDSKKTASGKPGAVQKFIDWLTSASGQKTIADYRINGAQLFFPDAKGSQS
jgi:ABC-type tungstate transport system permease subunit